MDSHLVTIFDDKYGVDTYALVSRLNKYAAIVASLDGRLLLHIDIPEDTPLEKTPWWIPSCRNLCGHPLKRWHIPCLTYCRYRRRLKRKIPALIPITLTTFYRWDARPGWQWKNPLARTLATIYEWLMN